MIQDKFSPAGQIRPCKPRTSRLVMTHHELEVRLGIAAWLGRALLFALRRVEQG